MREFSSQIAEELSRGIKPDRRVQSNSFYAETLRNLKPTPFGLVTNKAFCMPWDEVTLALSGVVISWPFPQFFRGRKEWLLVDIDKVFTVDKSTYALTLVVTYDADSPTVLTSIPSGELWQYVDLGDAWLLNNGVCTVFKTNSSEVSGGPDRVFVNTSNVPSAIGYSKGRVFYGNLPAHPVYGLLIPRNVFWTSTSAGDVFWPLLPSLPVRDRDSYLQRNDAGYMVIPTSGAVLVFQEGSEGMLVGCSDCVLGLKPLVEPTPGQALRLVRHIGVASRGSLGGSRSEQLFIDADRVVWKIREGEGLIRLGYKDDVPCPPHLVLLDEEFQDFYVGSTAESLVITPQGAGKQDYSFTSLWKDLNGSGNRAIWDQDIPGEDIAYEVSQFDFGLAGIKMLKFVELNYENLSSVSVSCSARYLEGAGFQVTPDVPINFEGAAYIGIAGTEFILSIKAKAATECGRLSRVVVRWSNSDKRYVRGGYGIDVAAANS